MQVNSLLGEKKIYIYFGFVLNKIRENEFFSRLALKEKKAKTNKQTETNQKTPTNKKKPLKTPTFWSFNRD